MHNESVAQIDRKASTMLGIRDYISEFVGTALLVLAALSVICVDFATQSPMVSMLPDVNARRVITGVLIAGTATAIVYSPIGRRSGGHLNPAVTMAFLLLGKMTRTSAALYVGAQTAGALTGAAVALLVWNGWARDVDLGATVPSAGHTTATVAAEALMTFLLVSLILNLVDRRRLMRFTAAAVGALQALFIVVEAPVSRTSLNPARTLGPAVVGGEYSGLWIYLFAPPAGALVAVVLYRRRRGTVACGKLYHREGVPCGFIDCHYCPPRR
jgi:aquaporin Z